MYISTPIVVLFSLLPAFGVALPAKASAATNANTAPSQKQILNAVALWMNDTGKVSNFMNTATTFTGNEYTKQATIALNAEKDELTHKAVLDAAFGAAGTAGAVKAANATLVTKGKFQNVVDVLQKMVNDGPSTAQADVDTINNNRCVNVLPNIDAYFAAAGQPGMKAVRPTVCSNNGVIAAANAAPAAGGQSGKAAGQAAAGKAAKAKAST